MKKSIFLIVLYFTTSAAIGQLSTNFLLTPTPPSTLSEWANRKEVLSYIISSPAALGLTVIIKTEIKTADGTLVGTTDLAKAKKFSISTATTILYAADVLPLENILFADKYKTSLQRSGKLPADNYTICVQLVRPVDYTPASEIKCKSFYLASIQLPVLIKPYNEEVIDETIAQTAITFRWTPVVPRYTEPVTYRLQVFEVLPHQNSVQALRSNQPLLDKEIKGATQYIWRPQLSFLPEGKIDSIRIKNFEKESADEKMNKNMNSHRFIWTIQSLDKDGKPIMQTERNGEARSEPITFMVTSKQGQSVKKK
jgi:hypothetical protein